MTDPDNLRQAIDIIDAAEYSPVDMLELRSNPAYAVGYQEGWDDAPRIPPPPSRRDRLGLVTVVAAAAALILTGIVIGRASAAPRSTPDPVMSFADVLPAVEGPSGVPQAASVAHPDVALGAPLPSPTSDPGPAPATGAVGSPLQGVRGVASWCAPTPKYCHGWGGHALVGAVPTFHSGDRPYIVRVTTRAGRHVDVRVVGFCACGPGKVIDLSPWAFSQLATLGRGTVPVTVTWGWRIPPPPATDVEP